MRNKNFLKEKIASKKAVIGTWAVIPSVTVAEIIASAGIDFIIIDREHGPIGFDVAQEMIAVCESHQVSPLVRVPGVYEDEILKALDIGAHGLHVPNLSTNEHLKDVIRFSKYPPLGERGFSPFTRLGNFGYPPDPKHTESANHHNLLCIHVEGEGGVRNLDSFLQEESLDVVFVGLYDLSKSLGVPGETNHPEVLKSLEQITKKINNSGKYAGTIATSPDQLRRFMDMGLKYFTYSVDCEILKRGYCDILKTFSY